LLTRAMVVPAKSLFACDAVFPAASDGLLMSLKGHLSAITDLHYSKRGDRILAASQHDGVVRVWTWMRDPSAASSALSQPNGENVAARNVSQLILKLTNPRASATSAVRPGPLARPNKSPASSIACDVAVWVQDDTKIVTSQSELARQNGSAIVPGSQYLFLWDSITGHCLVGISGAHSMACPVVIPHPVLTSIVCSAGADGVVRIWDWDSGKCIFSHTNIADIGPIEPRDRGKSFGYLDGDFSPDGTVLVLTDDGGRVTVLDCAVPRGNTSGRKESTAPPDWMTEQYFSNDYYDLFYDINGYCVERGSERPPHLAPRGARCSHSGAPFSMQVNEAFKGLCGPIPISAQVARWHRQFVREMANRPNFQTSVGKGTLVGQFDPLTSTLIQHDGSAAVPVSASTLALISATPQTNRSQIATIPDSSLRLSSNYRWRDLNDIDIGDEDLDQESDDEDFELNESRNGHRGPRAVNDSDSEEMEMEVESVVEPSRTSLRRRQRSIDDEEFDDSGDEFDEYVSNNNSPSGVFIADYESHYFRMPTREQGNQVHRLWLNRNESSSSYGGRKLYTPQVGDEVVYIPQAHLESLAAFPGVQIPPWHQWPEEAAWPVVRCTIRNVRYRFPFKDYKTCNSVVAKLTMEVTGIPELSSDRILGWPMPTFTTLTKCHVFEVCSSLVSYSSFRRFGALTFT
jgi:WD domain, G-beta repeat